MCKFFEQGRCKRGSSCLFAHGTADKREVPDLSFTKICPIVIGGRSCFKKDCKYAHHPKELRRQSAPPAEVSLGSDVVSPVGNALQDNTRAPHAIRDGAAAIPSTLGPISNQPRRSYPHAVQSVREAHVMAWVMARRLGGRQGDGGPMRLGPQKPAWLGATKMEGHRADVPLTGNNPGADRSRAGSLLRGENLGAPALAKTAAAPRIGMEEMKAEAKPVKTVETRYETTVVVKNSFLEVVVADDISKAHLRRANSLSSLSH